MLNVLANLRKYVVEARGCAKKSLDRTYLIKHHPFDKAKVYHTIKLGLGPPPHPTLSKIFFTHPSAIWKNPGSTRALHSV